MGTTVEKLTKVLETKESIRNAINSKGGTLTESNKFSDYVTAINNLSSSVDIVKPIYTEQKVPVPNTGHLEKIFFNTKLTTDQVDALIKNANLTFEYNDEIKIGMYSILLPKNQNKGPIVIVDYSRLLGIENAWSIGNLISTENPKMYYVSPAVATAQSTPDEPIPAGWNEADFTSFDTGEITLELTDDDELTKIAGIQNDLLTDLVYSYSQVDTGEVEIIKTLTDQYKLVEQNIILDTKDNKTYTYDFINNINEDTKEINVIKNIEVDPSQEDDTIITRQITTYTNDRVSKVGDYAFYTCTKLTSASFPNATVIERSAFYGCTALINIEIPLVTTIYEYAFQKSNLKTVTFPQVRRLSQNVFYDNVNLREANLPQLNSIDTGTFYNCARLIKIFISQTDKVCTLIHTNAFTKCYHILGTGHEIYNPRAIKDGYIYVPASLLSQYKVAQNWTTYASQIIGHEDLEAGATLPNYTTSSFTKQTWYSDEKLTTVVTSVTTSGTYYCRLEA